MTKEQKETKTNVDDGYDEIKPESNYVKFNKINDYVKGTYISRFDPSEPDQYGKKNPTFTLIVDDAAFHGGNNDEETGNYVVDSEPTKPEPGTEWRVGSKPAITRAMEQVEVGQKVMFKLTEFRKSDKGKPAKIIKVLGGPMDKDYLAKLEEEKKAQAEWDSQN